MCTLSIYTGKKRCVVTMNRDEVRTRKEAGLIHSRSRNGVRLFFPVDSAGGGTWFGINDKGVVMCLLNRYQTPEVNDPQTRGNIIPRALEQGAFNAVNHWLRHLDYAVYNPFDLFLISRKQIRHFSWDGQKYTSKDIRAKHWYMFTSTSVNPEEVIAYRHNIFDAWSSEMGKKLTDPEEILRGFHLIQMEGMESQSVLMEREHSHTRSVIQVDVNKREMTMKYFPEILMDVMAPPLIERVDVKE